MVVVPAMTMVMAPLETVQVPLTLTPAWSLYCTVPLLVPFVPPLKL